MGKPEYARDQSHTVPFIHPRLAGGIENRFGLKLITFRANHTQFILSARINGILEDSDDDRFNVDESNREEGV